MFVKYSTRNRCENDIAIQIIVCIYNISETNDEYDLSMFSAKSQQKLGRILNELKEESKIGDVAEKNVGVNNTKNTGVLFISRHSN
jgi:hypothetical protein